MSLPLCRCRVLYIGSAVPTITKDGLQGIQQPLRERYPVEQAPTNETRGIDSWLSVWSNGLLLEYIEGEKKSETAFFPINSLHYCAAVRYVNVSGYSVEGGGERFLPLDSPFANIPDSPHPPIFAAILRRTTGVKVLECHGFICTNNKAANALVRCCFHAYADSIYLKIDDKGHSLKAIKEGSTGERSPVSPESDVDENSYEDDQQPYEKAPKMWSERRQQDGEYDSVSISSSLVNKNKNKSQSETGDQGEIVPFEGGLHGRRFGSEQDLYRQGAPFTPPGYGPPPRFGGPPPGFPPMHMGPPFFPPPPHGMMFPPPPPPPPHMFRPPFMRGPPPPPMFFRPPPFPFFPPPPPHFGHMPNRPASPNEGPIITGPESVYGTMRRGAYEEPTYMGGNGVPDASYQPSNYPPENYDNYYDTFKKRSTLRKGENGSFKNGEAGAWDQYEAGIYRKSHLNEKAFSGTLRSMAAKETSNATLNRTNEPTEIVSQTVETEITRPDTPPVDYEALEKLKLNENKV